MEAGTGSRNARLGHGIAGSELATSGVYAPS